MNLSVPWQQKKFAEVAEVVTGSTPPTQVVEFYGGDIPFVTPVELENAYSKRIELSKIYVTQKGAATGRLIPKNAIMVSCIGSLGKVGIAGKTLITNQQINSLIFDKQVVEPLYGYYYCTTLQPYLEHIAPSTTVKIVNKSRFSDITIPLPPIEQQKKIAAVLEKADQLRQKRRQANKKLDELLQSVFIDMFGDPLVNNKWDKKKLEECSLKITDGTHKTPNYVDKGVTFISAKNIINGKIDWNEIKFITEEEHKQLTNRCFAEKGDVLLTKSGSIGSAAIVERNEDFSLFESLALIKLKKEITDPIFLWAFLNNEKVQSSYVKSTKGIAVKHLHLVDIRNLDIIIPPINFQKEFAQIVEKVEAQKQKNELATQKLDMLFNSLMQRAFKGELEFNEEASEAVLSKA